MQNRVQNQRLGQVEEVISWYFKRKTNQNQHPQLRNPLIQCQNGEKCYYKSKGQCRDLHPQIGQPSQINKKVEAWFSQYYIPNHQEMIKEEKKEIIQILKKLGEFRDRRLKRQRQNQTDIEEEPVKRNVGMKKRHGLND